jgi:hypothetical protein
MGLRDILERHKVPIPDDFDERLDIIVSGLKKKPDFSSKMEAFKHKTRGGAEGDPVAPTIKRDSEDYLGPRLRWFLQALTSPYARTMLEGVFIVVFFLSYLERTPVVGSILSAGLDLMLAGGKIATKSFQAAIPAIMGLAPIPYASMAGLVMAAMFGFTVWPIFAMVSLSRQDFTAATESLIRVIPPPIGDVVANMFLEGNRAVSRLDEKRIKLGNDIANALDTVSSVASDLSVQARDGFKALSDQIRAAAAGASAVIESVVGSASAIPAVPPVPTMPRVPKMPTMPAVPKMPTMPTVPKPTLPTTMPMSPKLPGGFHRRTKRKSWRTRRTQRRYARR